MKRIQAIFIYALFLTWLFTTGTTTIMAVCPNIGVTYGEINYDSRSIKLTNGTGATCCLHHLKVLVVYENLEPGDAFDVHGATVSNDTDQIISGNDTIDVYALGNEQIYAFFSTPSPDSKVFLAAWEYTAEAGGNCSGLAQGYSAHGCNSSTYVALSNGSVEFKLRFGVESALQTGTPKRGLLWMRQESPNALLTSPKALVYAKAMDTAIDVVRDADRTIRQIRAEDGLLNIVTTDAFGYEIQFYAVESNKGWNGDSYETSAPPHYIWKIYNPDRNEENKRLRIEEHTQGFGEDAPPIVHEFVWNEIDEAWILTLGDGLSQDRKKVTWNKERTQKIELQEILDPKTGEIARRIERVYGQIHTSDPRMLLLSETYDPGPNEERTQYSYIDDPRSPNFERKEWIEYHDGNWKAFSYDDQGRLIREYSPWLNSPRGFDQKKNRVRHYIYQAPKKSFDTGYEPWRPRVVIETIKDREIARTYHLITEDQEWDIRCAKPGAKWDAPDNLVTKTMLITEGLFAEKPNRIEHEDGTISTYTYQIQNNRRIETVSHGITDDGAFGELTQGTRTTTITGSAGQLFERHTQDIATNLTLDRITYSEHDAFQRPERIDYHDGTHERILHDCCGPAQKRDREGRWTNLVYVSLKRPVYEITDTETRVIQYNAAGDVTKIQRLNAKARVLETVETHRFDLKGKEVLSENKGRQRRALNTPNPNKTITENPDGTNRIELRARDGQLLSTTGTAVHGIRYKHAIERDGKHHVRTETEIRLDAFGKNTREWTRTWFDALGRPYKTDRADGAKSLITYNHLGQTISQSDPDGVTTLYWQDPLGHQTETAIDMNRNGKIDYKGKDRITRTKRETVEIEGVVYTQIQTYQWKTENNSTPTLISETLQSADGLIRQQTLFPSQTQWLSTTTWTEENTDKGEHPIRTETTVHPDDTQTIRIFRKNLLITEQRLGSDDRQITRIDYTYDDQNRMVTQTDAFAGTTEYQYDDQGRRTVVIQPAPEEGAARPVTRYEYDAMDRVTAIHHPDKTTTHQTYWPTGELRKTWGSRQYPVEYAYDYTGRKSSMTTWQDFKNDTGKAITRWIYDDTNGQLISKRYHDGKGPDYTYTKAGRLKKRTWARGVQTKYDYNSAGDLVYLNYMDRQTPDIGYQFDRAGQRVEVKQGEDYLQVLDHDDLGKVISETVEQPGLKPHTITRTFDFAGRRLGFVWNDGSSGLNVVYAYNTAGKLSGVSDGTHEVAYQYLENSPHIEQIIYRTQDQDIMRTHKTRDHLGRLLRTGTERVSDGVLLSAHDYTYNIANQRTSMKEATGDEWKYGYDSLGQLVSAERKRGNGELFDRYSYSFDYIGNRKQTKEADQQTSYEANLINQYNSWTTEGNENRITRFRHDSDGNLLEDEKWHYVWNAENRLIAMESKDASKRLEFRYDPQGRRISKNVLKSIKQKKGWKKESEVHFVYDGWNIIAELNAQGDLVRSHLWGLDINVSHQGAGGVGGLIMSENYRTSTSAYALYDGNGNIVQYVNTDHFDPISKIKYDPYGNIIKTDNIRKAMDGLPFGFSTKFIDGQTQYHYYGFRYYNPENGRWLNRDPIEENGGINLYGFINNQGPNGWDNFGLDSSFGGLEGIQNEGCCINENFYSKYEKINSEVFICTEPEWPAHQYLVVNGYRVDFSTDDSTLLGLLCGPAKVEINYWIPVQNDTCEKVLFSPCLYGSDDTAAYRNEVLQNAYTLKLNPGSYNIISRSCRNLDTIILPNGGL